MPAPGPIVDPNAHLWHQRRNPVFWLWDRSLARDLIGDDDALPDVYTRADYLNETAGSTSRGIMWSDAGAADPVARTFRSSGCAPASRPCTGPTPRSSPACRRVTASS